jgi:hypothetical protein
MINTDNTTLTSIDRFLVALDMLWAYYQSYTNASKVERSKVVYASYQYQIDRAKALGFGIYRDDTGRHHEATI